MYFKPTGSVIQLMDGRIFKRNQKNIWEDINSGVMITEQQLNFMVSSTSFSADASSGGGSRKTPSPLEPVTSLSSSFDDIVEIPSSTVTGTNRTIVTTEDPLTLTVNFEAGGLYSGSTILAYKNDTTQVMNFRTPSSGIASPSPRILSETFANGDQLKFAVSKGANTDQTDYDVTIQKTAPGSTQVLDTFNVSYTP